MNKYVTTPIYYANAVPHIGSAYCTLAADTVARFWRKKIGKEKVLFVTGTDENSQKIVEAAEKVGKTFSEFLDEMSGRWKETFQQIGIVFDDFIRTTEERHFSVVQEMIGKIEKAGDIYKGVYRGFYCTGCESFYKKEDLDEQGHCPVHKKPAQKTEEENYFFRLSKYEKPLLEFYEKNPEWLRPEKRKNEILSFIKSGLEDISISRSSAEVGIPLPMDENHKIYVWFDALINYYTATRGDSREDFWGSAFHIIGKDITRFHCIIWPAMLMSAGISLPKGVFAHGFFTIDGHKMSKSFGNVVDPLDLHEKFGNDALRVGLLSSFEFGNDGDFSAQNFESFYNTKLAGGVGNLFNRVLVLLQKLEGGTALPIKISSIAQEKYDAFETAIEALQLKKSIDIFFEIVGEANEVLNKTEVWKLMKTDPEASEKIFSELLGYLQVLSEISEILLPESAPKMRHLLSERIGGILFERK